MGPTTWRGGYVVAVVVSRSRTGGLVALALGASSARAGSDDVTISTAPADRTSAETRDNTKED